MSTTAEKFGHSGTVRPLHGGHQWRFRFDNGYGASVVQHSYSYGGNRGLFEVAVLGRDGDLNYDTPVTDDVLGRLSESEVEQILAQIEELDEAVAR